ncbi:hypothetical protein GS398_19365 [Pedobacter sp. HMF7056]|uniref:Cupin domain-containing protein n=1 Tax=Hufsiella ginkgonis TaxID=2695274 RepID=A0A7K1Y3M1_9SPHI|nr:hypothetical protein [Hufsiella ginkgonis]
MEKYNLADMVKGWFVGNFEPTLYRTNDVEVGVKQYAEGEYEASHHHKIATEFTVIVTGEVEVNGKRYSAGDILKVPPGTSANFRTLTPVTTCVVKVPGAGNDKYVDPQ